MAAARAHAERRRKQTAASSPGQPQRQLEAEFLHPQASSSEHEYTSCGIRNAGHKALVRPCRLRGLVTYPGIPHFPNFCGESTEHPRSTPSVLIGSKARLFRLLASPRGLKNEAAKVRTRNVSLPVGTQQPGYIQTGSRRQTTPVWDTTSLFGRAKRKEATRSCPCSRSRRPGEGFQTLEPTGRQMRKPL